MTKKFHSCPSCSDKRTEEPKASYAKGRKIKILHGAPGVYPFFEGFTETDHDFVHNYVVDALAVYRGKQASEVAKEDLEAAALKAMAEISDDEFAIHWNTWDKDRVSFTIHAKSTTYEPRFAPGCTITVI